jgi:hypothetical protein
VPEARFTRFAVFRRQLLDIVASRPKAKEIELGVVQSVQIFEY